MSDGVKFEIQRRFKRADINLQVGFIHRLKYSLTYATQISEGGILLCTERTCNVNEPVEVSFIFPHDGRLVFLAAEAAYSFKTKAGFQYVGVRFLEVPPSAREQIRYYVSLKT